MLEQLERHEIEERQLVQPTLISAPLPAPEADHRQRHRMVVALALLLVALGLVLVKDRDFWFPSSDVADSEPAEEVVTVNTGKPANPDANVNTPAAPVTPAVKKHRPSAGKVAEPVPAEPVPAVPQRPVPRAVLPPLRIQVEASGNHYQVAKPESSTISVNMQPATPAPSAVPGTRSGNETAAITSPAAERVEITSGTQQALASRPVRPEYPLLARQMKVEGEVVLDAWIGQDGGVQTLNVVGGPAILVDAAQAAVRQWHFKPHYQDGQPVVSQARIAVDFTIRRTDK